MSHPISWTEVRVCVPRGWQELVAEALALSPCTTVSVGNPCVDQEPPPEGAVFIRTFFQTRDDAPLLRTQIRASLEQLVAAVEDPEFKTLSVRFMVLPPEDYASSWKESWKPFRVLDLAVLPSWYEGTTRPSDCILKLDPGGSFGSGRHATTRTCLKILQERIKGEERVLDAGSGSGILSVSAALLGAREVIGFDIDDSSHDYGSRLAFDNEVEARCSFRHGGFEVLAPSEGGFDVVLANIYSDVIAEHAHSLALRLAPSGWFAFSGCPSHHIEFTRSAIQSAGLLIEEERQRGRWMTFVGVLAP